MDVLNLHRRNKVQSPSCARPGSRFYCFWRGASASPLPPLAQPGKTGTHRLPVHRPPLPALPCRRSPGRPSFQPENGHCESELLCAGSIAAGEVQLQTLASGATIACMDAANALAAAGVSLAALVTRSRATAWDSFFLRDSFNPLSGCRGTNPPAPLVYLCKCQRGARVGRENNSFCATSLARLSCCLCSRNLPFHDGEEG